MRVMAMLLGLGWLVTAGTGARTQEILSAKVQLDLGADLGQNFGTLFEVTDATGRVVMGAGFPGVFNTQARLDRYKLQVYVRPSQAPAPAWEHWPKPWENISGGYLFDLDGRIYATGLGRNAPVFDPQARQWKTAEVLTNGSVGFGDGVMRLGQGLLEFQGSQATYEGQVVLPKPETGVYRCFYYAAGHLCFYHHKPGEDGFNRVSAVPWKPGDPAADLTRLRSVDTRYGGEVPFAWGQLRQEAMTVSNNGGVYVFDGQDWRIVREADNKVSFQVYSAINVHDELWLAQYPSGNLFVYDGVELRQMTGAPPVMPGVAGSSREAQSTMIYGGEVYVGVWPWSELWRLDRDSQKWVFVSRMFTQPPVTDKVQHPFEAEVVAFNQANDAKLVANNWGQRLTSMAAWQDSLLLGTSSKGVQTRDTKLSFLTDEVFAEYGRLVRYTLPGNLAAPIKPAAGPTELRCVLTADRLRLEQDGKLLAETSLPPGLVADLKPAKITWGRGLYGRLAGKLSGREVTPRLPAGD